MNIPTGSNWPSGFREEDKNVKAYGRQRRSTTDPKIIIKNKLS